MQMDPGLYQNHQGGVATHTRDPQVTFRCVWVDVRQGR